MVDLTARPLRVAAVQVLEVCDSSEAVLGVLGEQADVFDECQFGLVSFIPVVIR